MAIIFALITFIGWGAGDIIIAIVTRKIGYKVTFFWSLAFSLLLCSFYIPFAGEIKSWEILFFALFLGVINILGTLVYYRGLEVGNASIIGAFAGSFSIVTVVLSFGVFGEPVTLAKLIGIFLVVLGIILSSIKYEDFKKRGLRKMFSETNFICSIVPMLSWGIYFAFIRIPAEKIGWFWAEYPRNLFFIVLLLFMKNKKEIFVIFQKRKILLPIVSFVALIQIAMFSYNLGILSGYTSLVAPIAGSSPVLFVILARIIFKEKLTQQQKYGVAAALAGIVLVSSSSL